MSGIVGQAFVEVKPLVRDFRGEVARDVNANLGRGGAVPLPVQPTITPEAKQAFGKDIGGLRGLLLGSGQFAASRALGISGAAAGLFLFGEAALSATKSAANLEQELNVFQQVSGATADQMKQVREQARSLGADITLPAVSAGDAATTMTELAKAGLNVNEVLKGTRGTLQLAAAANIDFATSAELVANALNAFQRPGQDAVKVADLLAGAANAAQGDISDFGVALSQSAAVAHQAGITLQDTVVFLTELAKAGIQGSDAGTSLRVALLRLIAPTTQAQKIFRTLGIEINDAAGNVRLDVFDQLRAALERLTPATRNQALATIFGSDAVRAAAIFVRDGAAGHEQLARQVERSGQAGETAAARTKGLAGTVQALQSNVETLGIDLGTLAIPLLTALGKAANEAVGDLDLLVVKLTDVGNRIAGIDLGPFGSLGDIVGDNVKRAATAPFQPLHAGIDLLRGDFKGAAKDLEATVPGLTEATDALFGGGKKPQPFTGITDTISSARAAGETTGKAFNDGVVDALHKDTPAVIAAKRTVEDARRQLAQVVVEGQKTVQALIRQGEQAVEAAAVDAKQNLAQIASTLSQDAIQILDNGPLAQRIQRLQDRLGRGQTGQERSRLRSDLRDAQQELARAQQSIAGGGGTAAQRAAEQDFLRPFREKVGDAKAALEEFNTQGTIDKLTRRLEAQKARLQKLLDDVIARFNAGLLSAPQANAEAARILQANVGPMSKAGKNQGFAFRQGFLAQLEGLGIQIADIAGGPQTAKTGAEPRIVSPAQVAAQAAADVKAARDQATRQTVSATNEVTDAVKALHRTENQALNGPNGTVQLLTQIRDQLRGGTSPSKKSSTVAPAPRGTRSGGR